MDKDGYDAYERAHKETLKGRRLEGEAFMKAVHMLQRAHDFPGKARLLVDALNYTRRLWMIVQADLSSPDNPMNPETKTQLLSLATFVDQQCLEIVERSSKSKIQALIDVNRDVAAGLLSQK